MQDTPVCCALLRSLADGLSFPGLRVCVERRECAGGRSQARRRDDRCTTVTFCPLSFPTAKALVLQTVRQRVHRTHSVCGFSSPCCLYLSIRLGKLTEIDCCIRSFSCFPHRNQNLYSLKRKREKNFNKMLVLYKRDDAMVVKIMNFGPGGGKICL